MADFNRIIIVGNLTRNPDYKQLPSGQGVCRLGLAANRQFKNRQTGENVQEVCFVDIDVWGAQAESCNQYLEKGRPVLVEGRLKYDTWQDAEGNTRSKHSIVADRVVFLGTNVSDESYAGAGVSANLGAGTSNFSTVNAGSSTGSAPKKAAPAKAAKPKVERLSDETGGDLPEFKDEPPFSDDLPF